MNQILRITLGLTLSCLIAGSVMGGVFILTAKAKKHNEHMAVQETMLGLLGYGERNPAPADLHLYQIYRYVIDEKGDKFLGYMIPLKKGDQVRYGFLGITLDGQFKTFHQLEISPEAALEETERATALKGVLHPPASFIYADQTIVARLNGKRLAYLLPGEFQGFKTFIKAMLALDPSFKVLGVEILENEEDPGLGGEIVRPYFKNQFRGKSYKKLKELEVVKKPLPEEYREILEAAKGHLTGKDMEEMQEKWADQDIYAITGATISSSAVTEGVKGMARRFVHRIEVLDRVVASRDLPAAF
jgi:electron transport complex protein RnfG